MSTSGTYNFGSPQSEQIIREAYERIGILPDTLTQQKIDTAQRSINFILQEWVNKGNNLWTIRRGMIGLNPNQSAYNLPLALIDIKTATLRTSTRNLGGTAFSSAGGIASNAFDGNPATACTQTAPNGYISYNWGAATYAISMVGVQSNATLNYTLACETSNDNITWTTALNIPIQSYPIGNLLWFVVPVPTYASYFRVRETGGATLNIQELYFSTNISDTPITRISEYEYTSIINKSSFTGRPSSFYVDRQVTPILYLWPTPNSSYNNLYFSYWCAMQDIGAQINNAEVPARFLEALCAALAFRLAVKEGLPSDRVQMLESLAEVAYHTAGQEDRERVPLRIYGDYMQGWLQS